jgi:transglutaminase-like putative cysteine protease
MRIRYGCEITFRVETPTPTVCLVDLRQERRADAHEDMPFTTTPSHLVKTDRDVFGNVVRRFVAQPGETTVKLGGTIEDSGALDARDPDALRLSIANLPADALQYLSGSRYCETDKLSQLAWDVFGAAPADTQLIEDICTFVHENVVFDYARARNTRTALETLQEGVGVCRDFAHLAIALCRSLNIPARYVNGYLGDIGVPWNPDPMDFNAWFEVYIGGRWTTFDARHNTRRIGRLAIAHGRDAADVPMLQTFGPHVLTSFTVTTHEVNDEIAAEKVSA